MSSFAMPDISAPLTSTDCDNYSNAYKDSKILSDETIAHVRSINPVLISHVKDGKRRISLHLIAPPSNSPGSDSPGPSNAMPPRRYVTIPTHLESQATFEFLGFEPIRAELLWRRRMKRIIKDLDSFDSIGTHIFDWATAWVERICVYFACADSTDDWDRAMEMMGINDEIRAAFAKPEHNTIRLIQDLSMWLTEIIEANYDALATLEERILLELDRSSTNIPEGEKHVSNTIPQTPDGHFALYKSVDYRGGVVMNATPNLFPLRSNGPTDLCSIGALYFTQQHWVATQYSALISDA
jgi:hypothetical protein